MMSRVASVAVSSGSFEFVLLQRMLDFQMAIETVNLVFRDMLLVDEDMVVDLLEIVHAIVTNRTAFARNRSVTADQIAVAVRTIDTLLVGHIVREDGAAAEVEFGFGDLVAPSTCPQAFVEESFLEVAKEASRGRHGHVLALDNLAMTTRTAQLLTPPEFFQMRLVVESDPVELDSAG